MNQTVKKAVAVFALFDIIVVALALLLFGIQGSINAQVAYFGSTLIMLASFYGYYQKSKSINKEEFDLDEVEKKGAMKYKKVLLGNSLFFSLYRLFAYAFFIVSFFVLLRRDYFDVYGFVLGALFSSFAVAGFFVFIKYTTSEQSS
jgi:hypothetical protein